MRSEIQFPCSSSELQLCYSMQTRFISLSLSSHTSRRYIPDQTGQSQSKFRCHQTARGSLMHGHTHTWMRNGDGACGLYTVYVWHNTICSHAQTDERDAMNLSIDSCACTQNQKSCNRKRSKFKGHTCMSWPAGQPFFFFFFAGSLAHRSTWRMNEMNLARAIQYGPTNSSS